LTSSRARDAAEAFEARATWWSALAANGLVLAASADRLVSDYDVPRVEMIVRVVSIAYLVAIIGSLVSTRRRPSMRLAMFAWIFAIVPYVVILPFIGHRWTLAHRPFEPLFRQMVAMLLLGAYAPARVVAGMAPIALLVVESAVEYWLLGMRENPYRWFATPGRIAFWSAIAFFLAYRRARSLQRERQMVEREQEALALDRLARVAVAVHDVTNSVVQTLMASAAVLDADAAQAPQVAPGMVRAVEKLKTVNETFRTYRDQVEWTRGDESFNAAAVLANAGAPPGRDEKRV
jgi:hypothetical protein